MTADEFWALVTAVEVILIAIGYVLVILYNKRENRRQWERLRDEDE